MLMSNPVAPSERHPHTALTGILIYDRLSKQGDFGHSDFAEYCYARLAFD